MVEQGTSERLVTPRGRFPHARVVGELIYVSGTSSRRPDNSIKGAAVDEMGTTSLDIRVQTRATRTTVAVHQLPHPHLLIEIQSVAHRR
jgi:2-aminomuconate deaminase